MAWRACLRCGSTDLAQAQGIAGVVPEGALWGCRRCGLEGVPMAFPDARALARFQAERAALYHPPPAPAPALPQDPAYGAPEGELDGDGPGAPVAPERKRSGWTRGLAGLLGFGLVLMGFLMFVSAAQAGGAAWATVGLQGVVAVLLGAPFVAIAARG